MNENIADSRSGAGFDRKRLRILQPAENEFAWNQLCLPLALGESLRPWGVSKAG